MESLKLPKGTGGVSSGGTSPTQTPTVGMKTSNNSAGAVSVHFNASEESVDELFPAADSGSGSDTNATNASQYVGNDLGTAATQTNVVSPAHPQPQQQQHTQSNIDEQARNFLQGNFFNRKRSGSIEAGVSPSAATATHSIAAALAAASHLSQTGDSTSVGTWKLIKGKVSQTIEDIKLSKSGSQNSIPIILSKAGDHNTAHDHDSDQENFILSSAISEEPETASENAAKQRQTTEYHPLHKQHDSESEPEVEVLEGDPEHSRLRRGLAHLKFKVKSKAQANQQQISTLSATLASARSNVATLKTMKKDSGHSRRTTAEHSSEAATDFVPPAPAATIITSTAAGTTLLAAQPSRTSLRTGFLRRRRKQAADAVDAAASAEQPHVPLSVSPKSGEIAKRSTAPIKERKGTGIVSGRKDIEIESGVEMMEDMIPQATAALAAAAALNAGRPATVGQRESIAEIDENVDTVVYSTTRSSLGDAKSAKHNETLPNLLNNAYISTTSDPFPTADSAKSDRGEAVLPGADRSLSKQRRSLWHRLSLRSLGTVFRLAVAHCGQNVQLVPALMMLLLFILIMLPIHDFLRGVFACLLSIALIETVGKVLQGVIESFIARNQPERGKFNIPDYGKMPICKLPAVEEHKNCKFYAGWMNEADCYDPDIFHISQTKPIYVRLEGTVLLVSTTNARIPKRVMWNETPIELSKISFTSHRRFDLTDCRIELLPLGLARKRFFNRKYPIQLIIKNTNNGVLTSTNFMSDFEKSTSTENVNANTPTHSDHHGASARSSVDGIGTRPASAANIEADFGATILNADLQVLQDVANPDDDLKDITVPCGDEVRLLLFSRGDREKEDWYRRFVNASQGKVHDQDLNLSKIKLVKEEDLQAAATRAAQLLTNVAPKIDDNRSTTDDSTATTRTSAGSRASDAKDADDEQQTLSGNRLSKDLSKEDAEEKTLEEKFEGLLMSSCVARNPIDYVQFMALYQDACSEDKIPVYKNYDALKSAAEQKERRSHKHRRARVKETDLWRGIDQSLFLGPSGSVVWTNVVLGRVLFSCLNDHALHCKIQEFLQKKINSLRLPSYMEDVVITQIYLGDTPPLIHRISQPLLDERGIWLDADITYEGFANITVTTKLNLLRLKKPATRSNPSEAGGASGGATAASTSTVPSTSTTGTTSLPEISQRESREWQLLDDTPTEDLNSGKSGCAIYDSDAESTGGSDTETESPTTTERADTNATGGDFFAPTSSSPGNARRIFKLVDRFTTSNFFQYATELSYVQRAMENMSANITLRVDIKGLVGRGTINLPPPPSDRVWLCFRGPPRLWISGHPTVGDKSVDWSIVTNVIESKLCEEVNKYLVYPNMVDITIPFLAQPSYNSKEASGASAPTTANTMKD